MHKTTITELVIYMRSFMFIDNLLRIMQEKGITKKQLTTDLKLGRNQIKYWEDHGNVPSALTVSSIASYLGVSPDMLIKLDKEKAEPDRQARLEYLNDLYSKLSDEEKSEFFIKYVLPKKKQD